MPVFEIPMAAQAQTFSITLNGKDYVMRTVWGQESEAWLLDIADANEVPLVQGIPMLTGADLLAQFEYLGIGGALIVQTDSNPDVVPGYDSLGTTGHLYFVTPL